MKAFWGFLKIYFLTPPPPPAPCDVGGARPVYRIANRSKFSGKNGDFMASG